MDPDAASDMLMEYSPSSKRPRTHGHFHSTAPAPTGRSAAMDAATQGAQSPGPGCYVTE